MLVQYFFEVDLPLEEVESRVAARHDDLGVWAEAAYHRGEETGLAVGLAPGPLSKRVELEIGEPIRATNSVTVPMTWKAVGSTRLFPTMEAELVLSPMGPNSTHVRFQGRYQPPLAPIGKILDRAALHRVAEITVRNLMERLAEALRTG